MTSPHLFAWADGSRMVLPVEDAWPTVIVPEVKMGPRSLPDLSTFFKGHLDPVTEVRRKEFRRVTVRYGSGEWWAYVESHDAHLALLAEAEAARALGQFIGGLER